MDSTNPKDLIGATKPPLSLVPPTALVFLAKVMELGAKKYGPYNWRQNKVKTTIYIDAALRHLLSYFDGESADTESNMSHLAHVMACMAIVLDAEATGNLVDDRPTAGKTAELIREFTHSEHRSHSSSHGHPTSAYQLWQEQSRRLLDRRATKNGSLYQPGCPLRRSGIDLKGKGCGRRAGDDTKWTA